MRRYAIVTRSVRWVENELRELPTYEGLPNLATFLSEFEGLITESQRLSALEHVLKTTPARWWGAHKRSITDWPQCKRFMEVRFSEEFALVNHKYLGMTKPIEHLNHCHIVFAEYSR